MLERSLFYILLLKVMLCFQCNTHPVNFYTSAVFIAQNLHFIVSTMWKRVVAILFLLSLLIIPSLFLTSEVETYLVELLSRTRTNASNLITTTTNPQELNALEVRNGKVTSLNNERDKQLLKDDINEGQVAHIK